jgi:FixJ family two-component response regulator
VCVVDDDPSFRRALTRLLRQQGFRAAGFDSAERFLAAEQADDLPSCVLVDVMMPGLSGLDLQDVMHQRGLDTPVIFMSGQSDLGTGIRAMKGGALDFLEKPVSEESLLQAVCGALDHDRRARVERARRAMLKARFRTLTPREREVFALVTAGLSNRRVGAELGAAEKTIKIHRGRVVRKMGATSLAELVRMADELAATRTAAPRPS